jgi:hypothetical protein
MLDDNGEFTRQFNKDVYQKIELERFSVIAPKPFDAVVSAFRASVGHPDYPRTSIRFPKATELRRRRNFVSISIAVVSHPGSVGFRIGRSSPSARTTTIIWAVLGVYDFRC